MLQTCTVWVTHTGLLITEGQSVNSCEDAAGWRPRVLSNSYRRTLSAGEKLQRSDCSSLNDDKADNEKWARTNIRIKSRPEISFSE